MGSVKDIKANALILERWLQSPQGQAIFHIEEKIFHDYWSLEKPQCVLQLSGQALLDEPAIHGHYFHVDLHPDFFSRGLSVCALFHRLPFPDQSMDLVVMPHVQEIYDDPRVLYREIDRVLSPAGRLLMFGVNTSSLWAVARVFGDSVAPWCDQLLPTHVSIQQCHDAGLSLCERGSFGFVPYSLSHWLNHMPILGVPSYGQLHMGAIHVLVFQKNMLSFQAGLVGEGDV